MKSWSKFINFHSRKCIWKCRLENGSHFVSASKCKHWKLQKLYVFIQENETANVVWKITAILSRPDCVNVENCKALSQGNQNHTFTASYTGTPFGCILRIPREITQTPLFTQYIIYWNNCQNSYINKPWWVNNWIRINPSGAETGILRRNVVNTMATDALASWWQPAVMRRILTHCGLVTPYGDTELSQHWFR